MSGWLPPILLVAFAAASRYAVDSRDGCDWKPLSDRPRHETFTRPNTPIGDLARIARALTRMARALTRFDAEQVDGWDRRLRLQPPGDADWLHWTQDAAGYWRLDGQVLPLPLPRQRWGRRLRSAIRSRRSMR
jgi:hypothetical protein